MRYKIRYNENPEVAVNTSLIEPTKIVSQPSALIYAQPTSISATESITCAPLQYVPEFIPRVSPQRVSDFVPRITGSEFLPSIT